MNKRREAEILPFAPGLWPEEEVAEATLPTSPPKMRIGERLIALGSLSEDQLRIALHEQKNKPGLMGETLARLGFITQDTLAVVLAAQAGIEPVDLSQTILDPELLRRLPKSAAARCRAIPLRLSARRLEIAMADPFDVVAMDEIRRHFPRPLEIAPRAASRAAIEAILDHHYDAAASIDEILRELETGEASPQADSYEHPIIRLVNLLLFEAARRGASDVHFEPENNFVRVRYRLDGTLRQVRALHRSHWPALSHRLKIMSGMNIADTRSIQDGRFQLQIGGGEVDFRAAVMPTVWGETLALRLLDHRRSLLPLEALGYGPAAEKALRKIAEKPQGITLITGPTGSGKTTTLYSLLRYLSSPDVHIATLEEPVEFQLDLIRQTAIQDSQGLGFAEGVRGLLRMDPDIIFLGEVRDSETAQMALRAAMTGHQVYSTLHCNEALGAVPRLIDLGLNPRTLAGNLSGLAAQRLVRKLCPHCKRRRRASAEECAVLRADPALPPTIAEAEGCAHCEHTGRKGRTVIAEILPLSSALDELIAADAPRRDLLAQARAEGFLTMQEDGIAKVLAGEIALADLRRAVDMTRMEGAG